jgi:hypothetical protein
MDLLKMGLSVVDWIGRAQDRYRWRGLVNAVIRYGNNFKKIVISEASLALFP